MSKSFKAHYLNLLCCGRWLPAGETDFTTRQSQAADSQSMTRYGSSKTRHEAIDQTEALDHELSTMNS